MKIILKIKNWSQRFDINRPIPRYGHKYTKYKMYLSKMVVICIKQQLSNIWSSIDEKVKQHWGWIEKNSGPPHALYYWDGNIFQNRTSSKAFERLEQLYIYIIYILYIIYIYII